jgi:hypothetical protein
LWYGHVEEMQNLKMPKRNVQATMEETRKRGRLHLYVFHTKRCGDEVEEDIKVMGMKNRQAIDRNSQARRKTVLKAKVCNRQ